VLEPTAALHVPKGTAMSWVTDVIPYFAKHSFCLIGEAGKRKGKVSIQTRPQIKGHLGEVDTEEV